MIQNKSKILLILLLSSCFFTFSQSNEIDSLYKEIKKSVRENKNPLSTVSLYQSYIKTLEKENKLDSCVITYKNLLVYIDKNFTGLKQDSIKSNAQINLGRTYYYQQNYKESIITIDKAIVLAKNKNLIKTHIKGLQNKSLSLIETSKFEDATAVLLSIPKLLENVKDENFVKLTKQKTFLNIGLVYLRLRNWDESIKYLNKSLDENFTDKETKVKSYLNLSAVYLESQKSKLALENALKADKLLNDIDDNVLLAVNVKNNIISAYDQLGENDKVLQRIEELINLSEKSKSYDALFRAYGLKALAYYKSGNLNKSVFHFEKAYESAKKSENYETLKDATQNLVEIYFLSKKYDKAYVYNDKLQKISDSISLIKQNKAVSNALIKYETLEKEKKITDQNLELQTQKATIASQRNTQILLLSGLGFLILGGLLFYNRNKAQQQQKLQAAILAEKEKGFAAVLKASEDERKRISKDLHDGIGQEMAALKMAINFVKENETDKTQKEALDKIYNNCSKSADEIRNISHQMMPRTLLESGLVEAVNDLLNSTFKYTDIQYKFDHYQVNERFDERIEISLYRVLQELINNVIKHANATQVNVLLYLQDKNLILMVEDNGVGMQNKNKKGHGVLNIKSRIDMVKGTINFQPSEESGTSAIIKVPL